MARQLQESACAQFRVVQACVVKGTMPGVLLNSPLCSVLVLLFTVSNWVSVMKVSKSRRHRQSKLDSSDSDSGSGQVQGKAAKRKRTREPAEPAGRKRSSRSKGAVPSECKEEKSLRLSMPIITEEEEEESTDGFSKAEFTAPKRKRKR